MNEKATRIAEVTMAGVCEIRESREFCGFREFGESGERLSGICLGIGKRGLYRLSRAAALGLEFPHARTGDACRSPMLPGQSYD